MKNNKPSILVWDIETSLMKTATFGIWNQNININAIIDDWYIICICWKKLGKKKVHSVSLLDDKDRFNKDITDDYHVVKTMRDVLQDVDILVAHNGDAFDLKKFNSRLIFHDLEPLPKILTVDTLKEARKIAKFTSNKLDYLAKLFGANGKLPTNINLWLECMRGDIKAIKYMTKYCKADVSELEMVYLRLRKYMKSHPNMSDIDEIGCPKCGSNNKKKHQLKMNASGIRRRQWQCKDCGSYFSSKLSEKGKPMSKL